MNNFPEFLGFSKFQSPRSYSVRRRFIWFEVSWFVEGSFGLTFSLFFVVLKFPSAGVGECGERSSFFDAELSVRSFFFTRRLSIKMVIFRRQFYVTSVSFTLCILLRDIERR